MLKANQCQSAVEEIEGVPIENIDYCSVQPDTLDINIQFKPTTVGNEGTQHNNLSCGDSMSRPSRILKRSLRTTVSGDGDVWVEQLFRHKISGALRSFFCSTKTGKKRRDEPPTGASKVIYLY